MENLTKLSSLSTGNLLPVHSFGATQEEVDSGPRDITQHEILALQRTFNLADAHTHQGQSATQERIIERLPALWYEAERRRQREVEDAFIESFCRLHNQRSVLRRRASVYLTYAASISTMIAAMYLRARQMRVALIEPCFDNLHDLLVNTGVRVSSVPEEALWDTDDIYRNLIRFAGGADALFLVDPNNPTGFSISANGRPDGLREVLRFCRDFDKLLLLDVSFAAFALMDPGIGRFDIYEELDGSRVSYISMEDTGKTWPLQDAKCALLIASDDITSELYNVHTSVLLNVSPFILNLVREYVEDSSRDGFASVRNVITDNRETVIRALESSVLSYCEPRVNTSVAWFEITSSVITSTNLQRYVLGKDIYVLPGTFFYWHHREIGERYVRIALARDSKMMASAMENLRSVLDSYGS